MSSDPLLDAARRALELELDALKAVSERVGPELSQAASVILENGGKVVVTGIGKSGRIGQKIASTLCSTGTPAVWVHAGEAMHGDLGIYQPGDPTILISKSGSTTELLRLIPTLREFHSPLIALVGNPKSELAAQCDHVLDASVAREADPLGIVPTASALVTLALGDALAAALMQGRQFESVDFARFHPAGQLGRNLMLTVQDVMHGIDQVACVQADDPFHELVIAMTKAPLGAACIVDTEGALLGIVTDGDLRRALSEGKNLQDLNAGELMTADPISIPPSASLDEAVQLMEDRPSQISVLPVLKTDSPQALGLIRIHDIYQPNLL